MLVKDLSELHHYCLVKSRLDNSLKRIIPSKPNFVELVSLYLLLPFLALNALLFELSRSKVVASTCSNLGRNNSLLASQRGTLFCRQFGRIFKDPLRLFDEGTMAPYIIMQEALKQLSAAVTDES